MMRPKHLRNTFGQIRRPGILADEISLPIPPTPEPAPAATPAHEPIETPHRDRVAPTPLPHEETTEKERLRRMRDPTPLPVTRWPKGMDPTGSTEGRSPTWRPSEPTTTHPWQPPAPEHVTDREWAAYNLRRRRRLDETDERRRPLDERRRLEERRSLERRLEENWEKRKERARARARKYQRREKRRLFMELFPYPPGYVVGVVAAGLILVVLTREEKNA